MKYCLTKVLDFYICDTFSRVLNCCVHVIDEQVPGPTPVKPSLPSLPNAPSLSPIKRKNKMDSPNDSPAKGGTPDGKTPSKQQKGQ